MQLFDVMKILQPELFKLLTHLKIQILCCTAGIQHSLLAIIQKMVDSYSRMWAYLVGSAINLRV